jgi:hypothetical protein
MKNEEGSLMNHVDLTETLKDKLLGLPITRPGLKPGE